MNHHSLDSLQVMQERNVASFVEASCCVPVCIYILIDCRGWLFFPFELIVLASMREVGNNVLCRARRITILIIIIIIIIIII